MTQTQNLTRSEFVRQRHSKHKATRWKPQIAKLDRLVNIFMPAEPRPTFRQDHSITMRQASKQVVNNSRHQRYDIAFTMANTRVRTPGISLPQFGTRWISALLTAILIFVLYMMMTSSTFIVTGAEIRGNQRLGVNDLNAALHMIGQPIFLAVPAQIEQTIRADYPDLSKANVHVNFPNRIVIDVVERTPVLAWYQDKALAWIDSSGVAFPPRGEAEGLINIVSDGTPSPFPVNAGVPIYEHPYIAPELVHAMSVLYPFVPSGMPMIYDLQYGMGWEDTRGWQVFFGQDTNDIPMKIKAYQAIVDMLTRQGIQPKLISMEYLQAPFYK